MQKTSADIAPMTEESAVEMRALAKRPGSQIDLSDASDLDAEGWWNAVQDEIQRSDLIRHSISNTHEAPAFSWRRVAARFSANRASTSAAGINLPALAESSPA